MKLKSIFLISAMALVSLACQEPNRDALSYQALPAYDIVKAIQNKDFEVFSRLIESGSDADQNFSNLAQFQKLCAAFDEHSKGYDGWDMRRNEILSRLISRAVEKDETYVSLTSRLEEVAYDIFVTQKTGEKGERRSIFVARIYAQGKTYRQLQYMTSNNGAYWQETSWAGGSWKATKISVPGLTNEDLTNVAPDPASKTEAPAPAKKEFSGSSKRPLD